MIPIAIVGHYARAEAIESLAEKTTAEAVVMDNGSIGAGANHERAWGWLADHDDDLWGVCLEDDALPIDGFRSQLITALEVAPSPVVSLYLGRARPGCWMNSISSVIVRDESWLMAETLLHHVAVAMRISLIGPMLTWLKRHRRYQRGELPITEAVGAWVRHRGLQVAYAHPSLVDHNNSMPTVIQHRVSSYPGETGQRPTDDPAEQRRAWVLGPRSDWDGSTWQIPTPVGIRGVLR